MGFHKKTPGAMPSGVGLPGVLCKEPYWMEESVLDGRIRQFSGVAVCSAGGRARTVRFVAVPSGKLVLL